MSAELLKQALEALNAAASTMKPRKHYAAISLLKERIE